MADGPVGKKEFATLMAPLGPFETKPRIAVACSGGSDSLALALLMRDWAAARDGGITALIVDHAIRTEAAGECRQVVRWLDNHGITGHILKHSGPTPTKDIQASAREARYRLMANWCEAHEFLHLVVGHHLEDQAETFMLRLARGSGVDGLSAMPAVSETAVMRVLRPLLPVAKNRLVRTLRHYGQTMFIEDPSNQDTGFARVRMRNLAPVLTEEGLTPRRLAQTAARMARARASLEESVNGLLSCAAVLHEAGYCLLALPKLQSASDEVALRALARIVRCIGGRHYPPRLERLESLLSWLQEESPGRGRTLGGCRILKRHGKPLLVCREPAGVKESAAARGTVSWDGRFRLKFGPRGRGTVCRLGADGWRQVTKADVSLKKTVLPAPVRPSLPAVWVNDTVMAVPHLRYTRGRRASLPVVSFSPIQPLTTARFTLH